AATALARFLESPLCCLTSLRIGNSRSRAPHLPRDMDIPGVREMVTVLAKVSQHPSSSRSFSLTTPRGEGEGDMDGEDTADSDPLSNCISDTGACALAEALPACTTLVNLDLVGNPIGGRGALAIVTSAPPSLSISLSSCLIYTAPGDSDRRGAQCLWDSRYLSAVAAILASDKSGPGVVDLGWCLFGLNSAGKHHAALILAQERLGGPERKRQKPKAVGTVVGTEGEREIERREQEINQRYMERFSPMIERESSEEGFNRTMPVHSRRASTAIGGTAPSLTASLPRPRSNSYAARHLASTIGVGTPSSHPSPSTPVAMGTMGAMGTSSRGTPRPLSSIRMSVSTMQDALHRIQGKINSPATPGTRYSDTGRDTVSPAALQAHMARPPQVVTGSGSVRRRLLPPPSSVIKGTDSDTASTPTIFASRDTDTHTSSVRRHVRSPPKARPTRASRASNRPSSEPVHPTVKTPVKGTSATTTTTGVRGGDALSPAALEREREIAILLQRVAELEREREREKAEERLMATQPEADTPFGGEIPEHTFVRERERERETDTPEVTVGRGMPLRGTGMGGSTTDLVNNNRHSNPQTRQRGERERVSGAGASPSVSVRERKGGERSRSTREREREREREARRAADQLEKQRQTERAWEERRAERERERVREQREREERRAEQRERDRELAREREREREQERLRAREREMAAYDAAALSSDMSSHTHTDTESEGERERERVEVRETPVPEKAPVYSPSPAPVSPSRDHDSMSSRSPTPSLSPSASPTPIPTYPARVEPPQEREAQRLPAQSAPPVHVNKGVEGERETRGSVEHEDIDVKSVFSRIRGETPVSRPPKSETSSDTSSDSDEDEDSQGFLRSTNLAASLQRELEHSRKYWRGERSETDSVDLTMTLADGSLLGQAQAEGGLTPPEEREEREREREMREAEQEREREAAIAKVPGKEGRAMRKRRKQQEKEQRRRSRGSAAESDSGMETETESEGEGEGESQAMGGSPDLLTSLVVRSGRPAVKEVSEDSASYREDSITEAEGEPVSLIARLISRFSAVDGESSTTRRSAGDAASLARDGRTSTRARDGRTSTRATPISYWMAAPAPVPGMAAPAPVRVDGRTSTRASVSEVTRGGRVGAMVSSADDRDMVAEEERERVTRSLSRRTSEATLSPYTPAAMVSAVSPTRPKAPTPNAPSTPAPAAAPSIFALLGGMSDDDEGEGDGILNPASPGLDLSPGPSESNNTSLSTTIPSTLPSGGASPTTLKETGALDPFIAGVMMGAGSDMSDTESDSESDSSGSGSMSDSGSPPQTVKTLNTSLSQKRLFQGVIDMDSQGSRADSPIPAPESMPQVTPLDRQRGTLFTTGTGSEEDSTLSNLSTSASTMGIATFDETPDKAPSTLRTHRRQSSVSFEEVRSSVVTDTGAQPVEQTTVMNPLARMRAEREREKERERERESAGQEEEEEEEGSSSGSYSYSYSEEDEEGEGEGEGDLLSTLLGPKGMQERESGAGVLFYYEGEAGETFVPIQKD
ncbi:hypothetical protein KIPB_004883, partial [Kipferlia bialata]